MAAKLKRKTYENFLSNDVLQVELPGYFFKCNSVVGL